MSGVLPSCWGSCGWLFIHSIAYNYNPKTDREAYFNFFWNLGNILPCVNCKIHYYQNVSRLDLQTALDSNESLFKWSYDLHNKVNQQTGVTKWPSYESVKKQYASFEASCSATPGTCGSGPNKTQKKMKVVEQFGDVVSAEQLPWIISTAVLIVIVIILSGLLYKRK